MELTFLGTGAGMPSKTRNVTAIMLNLLAESNELWLFDCGEATQHQLLHSTLKPRKLTKIFITHLHGDHLFGLPGLLSSRSFQGGESKVTIYGPQGIRTYLETILQISKTQLTYELVFVELEEAGSIIDNDMYEVDCVVLDHGIKSFGYRIIEKDRPGKLMVEELKQLGISPGPIYQQIKENEQTKLEDGQILYREDFLDEPKIGKKVVIFGDTRYIPAHLAFIRDTDVLVHEATFDAEKADLAKAYYHSTTSQAATFAKNANVGKLILTHISSRYQQGTEKMLLREARDIFPNTMLAYDFATFTL